MPPLAVCCENLPGSPGEDVVAKTGLSASLDYLTSSLYDHSIKHPIALQAISPAFGGSPVKITSAEVFVTCPGRNFVSLRLETEDGVVGWGDATLNGRELAVASYPRDHVNPVLPGRDAHAIEDTWQYLYRGGYWRRGPVTMAAVAAVDVALWDIKA